MRDRSDFVRMPLTFSENEVGPGMWHALNEVFPRKGSYAVEADLKRIMQEGLFESREYVFSDVCHGALLAAMKFGLGRGEVPRYPLRKDSGTVDPGPRTRRLENKPVALLNPVTAWSDRCKSEEGLAA